MNPFDDDIFAEGAPGAGGIHEEVLDALASTARELEQVGSGDQPEIQAYGRTVLLLAPRAGFGKSHLLSRLAERLQEKALFVPLHFEPELPITWTRLATNFCSLLQARLNPRDSKLTLLDEVSRFFFSQLVILGMQRGLVETDDKARSMEYVYDNFRDLFDPESGDLSRAEWFREAYEQLIESLLGEMANTFAIDEAATKFWGRTFYDYTYPKNPSPKARANALRWALGVADENIAAPENEHTYKRHFIDLAQIASAANPLIFVVDHLDGFHGNQEAGMRIAHFLAEIARSAPRSMTVLSTNQEVWNSMFAEAIPTAIEDRLTWDKRQLEPLALPEAERLIQHRLAISGVSPHLTPGFLTSLNLGQVAANARESTFTPRTLIRYARRMWDRYESQAVEADPEAAAKTVQFPAAGAATPAPPAPKPAPEPEQTTVKPLHPPVAAAGGPPPTPEETRERLKAVAEAIRQQSAPPRGDSAPDRLVQTQSIATGTDPGFIPGTLPATFQEFRLKHLEGDGPKIDPDRLRELVFAVGEHFPAVTQDGADPTADPKGSTLIWRAQGREIFLGFAAQSNYRFWQEMIGAGQERARKLGPEPKLKLVVFSPKTEPFPMARLFVSRDQAQEVSKLVDRIEMDEDLIASLYAAGDLIRDQRNGKIPFTSAQIFGFVATELDYFWRRVTRLGGAENRAAG
ncbi:MAG: hypothetical protein ACI8UO_002188 [Verrucomicrobiales bacterium]|jgi:hypothetical protein